MARRRSLNRRWSRRSGNNTGILNDDSNFIDENEPVWWKKLEKNQNSIRPSGHFVLAETSTTTELNPDSAILDNEVSGEWWEVLQKTSQDLVTKKIDDSNARTNSKQAVINDTSESDTDEQSRETKKRRINLRKSRKSLGKNAFAQALDSEPAIESEPTISKNLRSKNSSFQSLKEIPLREIRKNKNESILSISSNSSDTDIIRKTRSKLFKKPKKRTSHSVFNDVIEADESIIGPSQNTDNIKSVNENDNFNKKSLTKSQTTISERIGDDIAAISQNQSLNRSNDNSIQTSDESAKIESQKNKMRNNKNRRVLSSPANAEREKNKISESDNDSDIVISQRHRYFRKKIRKSSINPFDSILRHSNDESHEISSRKLSKNSNSHSSSLNKNLEHDQSSSLKMHLTPISSESSSSDINVQSRENIRQLISRPESRISNKDASNTSLTTSISEELKVTNPISQRPNPPNTPNKTEISHFQNTSLPNDILEDWKSSNSGASDKSEISGIFSTGNVLKENHMKEKKKMSTKKLKPRSLYNEEVIENTSTISKTLSNNSIKHISSNTSIVIEENFSTDQNKINRTRNSSKRLSNETVEEKSLRSQNTRQSEKISTEESETSDKETISKKQSVENKSQTKKILTRKSDVNLNTSLSSKDTSMEKETSDEEIITAKSQKKQSQSAVISEDESGVNDERIFDITSVNKSHLPKNSEERSKENVMHEIDSTQKSPISINKRLRSSDKIQGSIKFPEHTPKKLSISTQKIQRLSIQNSKEIQISEDELTYENQELFNTKSVTTKSLLQQSMTTSLEENKNDNINSLQESIQSTSKNEILSPKKKTILKKISKHNSKTAELTESAIESNSDSDIPHDPSVYELPNMNRSGSISLSNSDDENEVSSNKNVSKYNNSIKNQSLKNNSSMIENENIKTISTIESNDLSLAKEITSAVPQLPEPIPSSSGIQKSIPVQKSLLNLSKRNLTKSNTSTNQRSILNFITSTNSRTIPHQPLPTADDVRDFKEKLKVITMTRDKQKELQKEKMEKELEEMQLKLSKEKNEIVKRQTKTNKLRKKSDNLIKNIDKAFIVNGKVYKQPKLPRPKHWATDRLYKYLWKIMEPKYKLETRVRSEKFVMELSDVVTIVMRRKKYDNYKDEVHVLMKNMARMGIIKSRNDFYHFCYDFLPYEFRVKVTPILLPGNKQSVPFDPNIIDTPILNE